MSRNQIPTCTGSLRIVGKFLCIISLAMYKPNLYFRGWYNGTKIIHCLTFLELKLYLVKLFSVTIY